MKILAINLKDKLKDNIEANEYAQNLASLKLNNIIIFPKENHLKYFNSPNYLLGIQDIDLTNSNVIKNNYVNYVICGHFDKRKLGDTSEVIINKIKLAEKNNLKVIFCVGEILEERLAKKTYQVIERQIAEVLNHTKNIDNIIIAYEPVWSIGSNKYPNNDEITEIVSLIKKLVDSYYGFNVKVIYGGSVNLENINELNKIKILDGYIISSTALDPLNLKKLVEKFNNN